jgi:hypothetical protein
MRCKNIDKCIIEALCNSYFGRHSDVIQNTAYAFAELLTILSD